MYATLKVIDGRPLARVGVWEGREQNAWKGRELGTCPGFWVPVGVEEFGPGRWAEFARVASSGRLTLGLAFSGEFKPPTAISTRRLHLT